MEVNDGGGNRVRMRERQHSARNNSCVTLRVRYVGDVNTVVVKIYECITFKLHTNKCECRAVYAACVQHIFICTKRTYFIVFHLRGFYDTRFFHSFHALAHANMFHALKFNNMMLNKENKKRKSEESGWM